MKGRRGRFQGDALLRNHHVGGNRNVVPFANSSGLSIDRFFICETWHHIKYHSRYLALLRKMLKKGGQVVMIDFQKTRTPVGPSLEMRIGRNDLVRETEASGFLLAAEQTFLPSQYFLVFKLK